MQRIRTELSAFYRNDSLELKFVIFFFLILFQFLIFLFFYFSEDFLKKKNYDFNHYWMHCVLCTVEMCVVNYVIILYWYFHKWLRESHHCNFILVLNFNRRKFFDTFYEYFDFRHSSFIFRTKKNMKQNLDLKLKQINLLEKIFKTKIKTKQKMNWSTSQSCSR